MRRHVRRFLAGGVALTLVFGLSLAVRAADEDAAKAAAVKALDAGAALFTAKDAKGLAGTYTDDAVLTLVTREGGSPQLKREVKYGRAQIEEAYQELFKPDATFHAQNTVDYARFAGEGLLIIGGTFVPDTASNPPLKIPFVQVRVKEGDAWKIINLQVFFAPGP